MGGSTFLIFGDINHEIIPEIKEKKWKKILRKKTNKKEYIEYMCVNIKEYIMNNFMEYLKNVFQEPWESTMHILDYLDNSTMDVFLRKDLRDESEYLQIYFFTCAGLAEISSEVACHWFKIWYESNKKTIETKIKEMGFNPKEEDVFTMRDYIFIPTDEYGYAMFIEELMYEEGPLWSKFFEIDSGITELHRRNKEFRYFGKKLDEKYELTLKERKCRCQLCFYYEKD